MFDINFFKLDPYKFDKFYKYNFEKKLNQLTKWHYKKCKNYKKILSLMGYKISKIRNIVDLPFIPTRLFKTNELLSIKREQVVKTLLSSGTSDTGFSKIYLDNFNSLNQIKALKKIMESIIGKDRIPMIIIDRDPRSISKKEFNAKTAAILGFSYFGRNHFFLLNKNNKINYKGLKVFLKKYSKQNFLIFGFTSYIYEYLVKKTINLQNKFNMKNGILLHGGGWKKLEKIKISNNKFKNIIKKKYKIKNIVNYYGTVEQTGSIFIECNKCGGFKTSIYSDVIIRDKEFNEQKVNKNGILQMISLLPTSYPGHSILTEDIGKILHRGNCHSGFEGKCFAVNGRLKQAEIRGCSDVGKI